MNNEIIGQKFNRLTIIGIDEPELNSKGYKIKRVKCRCECGTIISTRYSSVKSGHTKGCGQKHRRYQDLTGLRFNKLVVLKQGPDEIVKTLGTRHIRWYCQCDCGNEVLTRGTSLRNGHTQSCGCLHSEANYGLGLIDLSGQKFGRWIVLYRDGSVLEPRGRYSPLWMCECECGEKRRVRGSTLRNGNSLSCGCYKFDVLQEKAKLGFGLSELELNTARVLDDFGVYYEPQYIFKDLKSAKGYPLSFDYMVYHDGDPIFLIECQGRQHYEPVDYFGGENQFKIQVANDNLKRSYVKSIGLDLIEIPYTEDDVNKIYDLLFEIFDKKGLV